MSKRMFNISVLLIIAFLWSFVPIVNANEINENNEEIAESIEVDNQEETEEKEEGENEVTPTVTNDPQIGENEVTPTVTNDPQVGETGDQNQNEPTTTENPIEEYKVAVITTKVDENGDPLSGAVLQIIDSEGNVVDEWTTDGTEHESLLPEGDYVLHEVSAPEGYKLASDKAFTVKVELNDVTAGAVHDDEPCSHYPTALFYIESNGEREEVYCVNQGWEEPHDVSYDGVVLTEENILSFMPDADPTMTAEELYNKVLDIIYHRTKAEEEFPDLTETEIRMITEYALKNYTSALYNNGTWARKYVYTEDDPKGYVVDEGNGSTLGKLAQHWWTRIPYGHGEKLPEIYAALYYYLIRDEDHHPDDMHLYVWSTKNVSPEGESYQNLLGIRWHNPYDENHIVKLTLKNEKAPKEEHKKTPKKHNNPQTGDSITPYFVILIAGLGALAGTFVYSLRKEY